MTQWDTTKPAFRFVSVRQQAAEQAEAAGRTPCAEKTHDADCPGDCTPSSCAHPRSVPSADGCGAYCAACGETLE